MKSRNIADFKGYSYCIYTGFVHNKSTGKPLVLREDLYYVLRSGTSKVKIKAERLCWMLGNQQPIPDGYSILHRNLDCTDNRLCNLLLLPSSVVRKVQEAEANLQGGLKISPHPVDQYVFVLSYRLDGKVRKERFDDSTAAKRKFKRLQLNSAKTLSKYCNTDI